MVACVMTTTNRPQLVPELACEDVKISRAFYVDILGFSVLYERPNQGFCYLVRDGVELMIEQVSPETWKSGELKHPYGRGLHFQIMTINVQDLHDRCAASGSKIFRGIEDAWYRAGDEYVGQRQFVVLDPDGFMIRFAEDLGKRLEPPESGRKVA